MKFPEQYRSQIPGYPVTKTGDPYGAFSIPGNILTGRAINIIATDGHDTGWEHVSASIHPMHKTKKQPSWDEMCLIKYMFWDAEDCVVQFHPPESQYVNHHPGVLHLWRQRDGKFPMPPKICV